jgi:hypothetical protein
VVKPGEKWTRLSFPSYREWKDFVQPNDQWSDDIVYVGHHTGNTHYLSSEAIAQHWFFAQFGATDPKDAVEPMIEEMISLIVTMNSFLEDAIGTFIAEELITSDAQRKSLGKVLSKVR